MKLILGLVLISPLLSQTIQNFAGLTPVSVTAANPAVVTLAAPGHGYKKNEWVILGGIGTVSNGSTVTLDTVNGFTYTFVNSLNNSTPNQVLIGSSGRDTAWHLYLAVNRGTPFTTIGGDGYGSGIYYSSATISHPTIWAANAFQSGQVRFYSFAVGPLATHLLFSTSDAVNLPFDSTTSRMQWWVVISGATGCWAGIGGGCVSIGTNQTPRFAAARYVDDTHYSLYITDSSTLNLSNNGSFAGQNLLIQPAGGDFANPYPKPSTGESWATSGQALPGNLYSINVPGCSVPSHELECSQSQDKPEGTVNLQSSAWGTPNSFSITSGVATMTFASAYTFTSGDYQNILPGSLVWLRNWQDTAATTPGGTFTHTTSLVNDASGTIVNQLVKYVPGTNIVRSVQYQDSNGATGGSIGVCQSGCGNTGTAVIADGGAVNCVMDNTFTAGQWVFPSGYDSRCHASTNFTDSLGQPLGVVTNSGSSGGTGSIWWNGLNRPYLVTGTFDNGNNPVSNGQNVFKITFNVNYPDGNYLVTSVLPGITSAYGGGARQTTGFATTYVKATPYLIYAADYIGGYNYPLFAAFMQDQTNYDHRASNHMSFWVKWSKPNKQCLINSGALSIGTYFMWPGVQFGSQGSHYYNQNDPEMYNGWLKYTINLAPSHEVSVPTNTNYPNDLMYVGAANGWHGAAHYLDRMTTFYQDLSGYFCDHNTRDVTGQTILISPVSVETVSGEPEELVRARNGQWAPNLFQVSDSPHTPTGNPGYSIAWAGPLLGLSVGYEVRFCPSSGHIVGYANCICNSTGTTSCTAADRVSTSGVLEAVLFKTSVSMANTNIYAEIKPISDPVMSTSGNTISPIWLITPIDTSLTVGTHINVTGVTGNTHSNQTNVAIAAVQPRQTFTLFSAVPWFLTGNTYSNNGGLIQVNQTFHGLLTGQTVQIAQATSTGTLNIQWVVTVVDANNFTLNGSVFSTICPCSGGRMRLDLPGNLVSIASDSTSSPNTICTTTTTTPHNMVAGWMFDIMGAPDSHLSDSLGLTPSTYTVTGTPSSTTFTFKCPAGTPISTVFNLDGPTLNTFMIVTYPGFSIPGTGDGDYISGGAIVPATASDGPFAEIFLPANGPSNSGSLIVGTLSSGGVLVR